MNHATFYKPSGKFNFKLNSIGFILMIIFMIIFGVAISWLYLMINSVMPIIYLCVLCAIGCSITIGAVGGLFVNIFKIRSPLLAVTAAIIALIFVNYIKWAIYVSNDCEKYQYSQMKIQTASEYYLGEELSGIESDESVEIFIKFLKENHPYKDNPENKSYWEMNDFDNVLGKTLNEVKESLLNMNNMSAYDYLFTYRKQQPHTISYLITHPSVLFKDIDDINEVGRWYIGHGHSLTQSSNVKGIFLYLVWIGEFIMLIIPAVGWIHKKASFPFIEEENSWAITDTPKPKFHFVMSMDQKILKNYLLKDINYLFNLKPLLIADLKNSNHYTLTYCRSNSFDKIFISLSATKIIAKGNKTTKNVSNIVEYMIVDKYYIATIYEMFGLTPPTGCFDNNQNYTQKSNLNYQNQKYNDYNTINNLNYEDIFNAPLSKKRKSDDFVTKELKNENSTPILGEMESLDSSNIDLDKLR